MQLHNFSHKLWYWLTRPSPDLPLIEQTKATLLASFLVLTITVAIAVNLLATWAIPAEMLTLKTSKVLSLAALILIPYGLSRTKYYRPGSFLTVFMLLGNVYFVAFTSDTSYLYYLLMPLFASSIFLSVKATVVVILLNVVFLFSLAVFTDSTSQKDAVQAALFVIFISFVTILVAYYRSREEVIRHREMEQRVTERTVELLVANKSLQQEIIEREQAEAALLSSEARFRALTELTTAAIFIYDSVGLIYVNPAAQTITDYSQEELLELSFAALVHPDVSDDLQALTNTWSQAKEQSINFEVKLLTKSKQTKWVDVTIGSVEYEGEEVLLGTAFDMTQRKQAEEALEHARQVSEILRDANLALTRSLDLEIVLSTLLDYLAELIPYDSANVMLRQGEHQVKIAAMHGYEPWIDPVQMYQANFDLREYTSFNTLVRSKQSLLISDVAAFPAWVLWEDDKGDYVKSWLGVPLIAGGEVIGLYSLDKGEAGFFTQEHLLLAETLAAQAAVAIQNAALFKQVRDGREQLRHLTQQIVTVQEEERRWVSRELHDEAGQALTALKFSLAMILAKLPVHGDQPGAVNDLHQHVNSAVALCESTMHQIRQVAHLLRPAAIDDLGLQPALAGFCRDFADHTSLTISFIGIEPPTLPDAVNITLYRFLQEALTNIARHAEATAVHVNLWFDESSVYLSVEDNGRGFAIPVETGQPKPTGGIGLSGMQERLQLVGGTLQIYSPPEGGSSLTARVPW